MNVQYLIQLLSNKLTVLANAKIQSFNAGDIDAISKIDEEILGVENTLSQLKLLQTLDSVATTANATPADVVATGVEVLQNPVQGPSADAVINGYDVSAYATDALYEVKIKNILACMPAFATTRDVDLYMTNLAPTTPLLGSMIAQAIVQYPVDIPLLIAIMQNDSLFGTLGVGARTNNPGNVGNTGSETRTYPSWQDGVTAVAEWLSRHHAVAIAADTLKNNLVISETPSSTTPIVFTTATSTPPIAIPLSAPHSDPVPFTTSSVFSTPSVPLPIVTPPSFQSSTVPIADSATTTPPVVDVATSTPPVDVATSTPQIPTSTEQVAIPIATSTPAIAEVSATSTVPIAEENASSSTSTP